MIEFQKKLRKEKNFYVINTNAKTKNVLVLFSSNGLISKFSNQCNTFELENILNTRKIKKKYYKIIYIRDVFFEYYLNGINEHINNLDKVVDLVKSLFCVDDIVSFCGYSSGAFAAMCISSKIQNVKYVYSFGGVIELEKWLPDFDFHSRIAKESRKYLNLRKIIISNKDTKFYFLYGGPGSYDYVNYEKLLPLQQNNFHFFFFNTIKHGDYCYIYNIPYLLLSSDFKLNNIFNCKYPESYSKHRFSRKLLGIRLPIVYFSYKIRKKIRVLFYGK